MDSDWFLRVIERSSVNSDPELQLSFGESALNRSSDVKHDDTLSSTGSAEEECVNETEDCSNNVGDYMTVNDTDKISFGSISTLQESESETVSDNYFKDETELEAESVASSSHSRSSSVESFLPSGEESWTCDNRPDDSVENLTVDDNDAENEEDLDDTTAMSEDDPVFAEEDDDDKEVETESVYDEENENDKNLHSHLQPQSLQFSKSELVESESDSDMEGDSVETDVNLDVTLVTGDQCMEETQKEGQSEEFSSRNETPIPAEQTACDKNGCENVESKEQEVQETTSRAGNCANYSAIRLSAGNQSALNTHNLTENEENSEDDQFDIDDESLMDFAGELGVIGSDSSDDESLCDDDTFVMPHLSSESETSQTSLQSNSSKNSDKRLSRKDSNISRQSTTSTASISSRTSRCSLVRRARVESRPSSSRSWRISASSNTSSASLCSRKSASRLSRTSLNRIPVTRKPSKRIQQSSSQSSISSNGSSSSSCNNRSSRSNSYKKGLPGSDARQELVQTEVPSRSSYLEMSEAEQSWLPPLAFTDEDKKSKKKPENKAVGALLQEFVRLRRSVSDEYEIAEQVCLRKKRKSTDPDNVSPEPNEEKLQKMERKRSKVIKEIFSTEKTYQNHLDMIVKYFEAPLRQNQIIPDHVIVTIFSNIQQIISINKELWQSLDVTNIGRAFLKMGPFLKLYSTYANNHERALATLMEWDQKSADFSKFRREQEEESDMDGLKLNALLITPVQRIPRYKLLLTELLENTTATHEDYAAIQEACRQISAVATHINEHIKQQDNFIKMLAIQKSLSGTAAPKLLVPGRMFVKEGILRKVSKNGTSSRERMFFLFSDILIYAKSKLVESTAHHSYVCCCILPLQHCSVTRVFGHSKEQGALFSISCKEESLLLYSDQKTVTAWMEVLTKTINELLENRQSLRKVSSAKQPLRKAALARLKKQEKELDPLRMSQKALKRNSTRRRQGSIKEQDTPTTSPQIKKSKLSSNANCRTPPRTPKLGSPLLDLNCLTPKSRRKRNLKAAKDAELNICKVTDDLHPVTPDRASSIDLDYNEVWKLHNESCIIGTENSPSRSSFHGFDPTTPQNRGQGNQVNSSRSQSQKVSHLGWEDALQTAAQTARLFHPPANYSSQTPVPNNGCSIQ